MVKTMPIKRKKTNTVNIGGLAVGGENPILVQSMTNTDTRNASATIEQIRRLEEAGCEIIRAAVPDMEAAAALKQIKKSISIPLVADIHFDYRLALAALENGVDKLRINPGNIGGMDKVRKVAAAAKERNVPIRIGVNSGSLEKPLLEKYGGVTAQALVESALNHIIMLEQCDFYDIIISIKASGVPLCLEAYRLISDAVPYPLHIGITEAGTSFGGAVKSSVGLGVLLWSGIGDTLRVSLTGDPVEEVSCGKEILKALELRQFGVEFISCPTCGRTEVDLIPIAKEIEARCRNINRHIKVAVMGCVVNGPGEAREADVGVACGKDCGLIFRKGQIVKKVSEEKIVEELMKEIELGR